MSGLTLEDRLLIRELFERYSLAIDNGRAEEWADTFTEDGVFEGLNETVTGRAQLIAFAQSHALDSRYNTGQHWVANLSIDGETDRAETFSHLALLAPEPDSEPVRYYIRSLGWYRDSLVRTPAGWRIVRRQVNLEPARPDWIPGFRPA